MKLRRYPELLTGLGKQHKADEYADSLNTALGLTLTFVMAPINLRVMKRHCENVRPRFNTNAINTFPCFWSLKRASLLGGRRKITRNTTAAVGCTLGKKNADDRKRANDFPRRRVSGDGYERRGQRRKSGSFLSAPRNLYRQLPTTIRWSSQ